MVAYRPRKKNRAVDHEERLRRFEARLAQNRCLWCGEPMNDLCSEHARCNQRQTLPKLSELE